MSHSEQTPQQTAAHCCAVILSIDSKRGNEQIAAKHIANEYGLDLTKLEYTIVPKSDLVSIAISRQAYEKLTHWASVSRTIDTTLSILYETNSKLMLTEGDNEQVQHTIGELEELQYALDDCNRAAKEVKL